MSVTKTGAVAALLMLVGMGPAAGQDFTLTCRFPQFAQVPIDVSKPCVGSVAISLAIARKAPAEFQIGGVLNAGLQPLACAQPLHGTLFTTAADIRAKIVKTTRTARHIWLRGARRTSEQYWIEVVRTSRRTKRLVGVTYTEFDATLIADPASRLATVAGIDRLAGQCFLSKVR